MFNFNYEYVFVTIKCWNLWYQVNDFLSGKAPLVLGMRVADHIVFIQLQLSTYQSRRHHRPAPVKVPSNPPIKDHQEVPSPTTTTPDHNSFTNYRQYEHCVKVCIIYRLDVYKNISLPLHDHCVKVYILYRLDVYGNISLLIHDHCVKVYILYRFDVYGNIWLLIHESIPWCIMDENSLSVWKNKDDLLSEPGTKMKIERNIKYSSKVKIMIMSKISILEILI